MSDDFEDKEVVKDLTTAENLMAWKTLLSSTEAKDFVLSVMEGATVLFGQTASSKLINAITNLVLLVTAFICVGVLAYLKLVPDGTTGVLAGIIIGYFFKKS